MTTVADDPERQAELIRQTWEEARREADALQKAALEPAQQGEAIRQNSVIYGALIAVGLILVQQFLTVTSTSLDWSAKICVLAFSVAIPLLAALILVNHQESFRRRATDSLAVRVTQSIAQLLAFVGVVAGFWHIMWLAGVGILVSSLVAMMVHSAGYFRLERAARAAARAESAEPAGPQSPGNAAQ